MRANELIAKVRENVRLVMVGKEETTDLLMIALLTGGHVLLEDVPGSGKTKLAKTFARSIDAEFKRIQFTPDLLPSDITGIKYFNMKTSEFEFTPGPAFTNILLADELNRATPKTQSGLLECMEERQITIEGETHKLPSPLMVIATQNPIESSGVFPLPEAQLDRFLMRLKSDYPAKEDSMAILTRFDRSDPLDSIGKVCTKDDVASASREVNDVFASPEICEYIVDIISATRSKSGVMLGASTRSGISLLKAAKGMAVIKGREFVTPDDVKALAVPVLAHRLILRASLNTKGDAADEVIREILSQVRVPTEKYDSYKL